MEGVMMARFTDDEYIELQRNLNAGRKAKQPTKGRGKRGKNTHGVLSKDVPPDDDGPCTANVCPDCMARYAIGDCDSNLNRRQFTRNEHGIDYDYFVCFCEPPNTLTRYK